MFDTPGSIIELVLGILLSLAALVGLFTALFLLLPGPIREARGKLEAQPWRSIFLGVLNLIGAGIVLFLLLELIDLIPSQWTPVPMGIVAILGLVVAIPTIIGVCAVIMIVSERLGKRPKTFITNLRGGGLILFACLTPVIGWFIFTPLLLFASLGSVVGSLAREQKPVETALPDKELPTE